MAAGFCIVNDIVLGIMELHKTYNRVMYIDLDVHHGDGMPSPPRPASSLSFTTAKPGAMQRSLTIVPTGVENAFQFTDRVLTVSLHHYAKGFYPGSGNGTISSARTKAVVNVPLKSGLSDSTLIRLFNEMIDPLYTSYDPDCVVLQCGVDSKSLL